MDLESCFRNPSTQEETTDENIDISNLSQASTVSPTRTVASTMKTTGNSPVSTTAAASVAAPGTTLIAAAYQNAAVYKPAQTMRSDKKAVEMEAVRQALEKTTRNTKEQTKIARPIDS